MADDAPPPDLVIFMASGLRADLGDTPGAEEAFLTPIADRIDLRFENAYASSPSQFVSLGTLLTGRYPSAIPMCGLTHTGEDAETDRPWCSRVAEGRATFPEVLALYGYDTALFRSRVPGSDVLAPHFQDSFQITSPTAGEVTAWPELTKSLLGWWKQHADAPRLAVVVVSDLMYTERDDLVATLGFEGWTGETLKGQNSLPELHEKVMVQYVSDAGELGRGLSQLLKGLDAAPAPRPRVALVGSSNGMSLGEIRGRVSQRDFFFSNSLVLERTTHVPLVMLVKDPQSRLGLLEQPRPQQRRRVVELVDVLPTLLTLGGAVLPASLPGNSLLGAGELEPFAYSEFGDMLAIRSARHTLTFRAPKHNMSALDPLLNEKLLASDYFRWLFLADVVSNPLQLYPPPTSGESHHRGKPLAQGPEREKELYRLLVSVRTGLGAPPPEALTAERLEALRLTGSEGYW